MIKENVLRKLQILPFILIAFTTFSVSAQIVTSKKEAQKQGTYTYADNKVSTPAQAVAAQKAETKVLFLDNDVVVVNDDQPAKAKSTKSKGGPNKTEAPVTAKSKKKRFVVSDTPDPDYVPTPLENYFATQIVNNAMQFEGVRYRGGGTTPAGMDCSGMVYATFQIFDVTLPRSSADMAANAGREVELKDVKKGDLLFFDNNPRRKRINHVGLVTEVTEDGEIKFIHASTSQGVMVSSMSEPYNSRTFIQANRVIED